MQTIDYENHTLFMIWLMKFTFLFDFIAVNQAWMACDDEQNNNKINIPMNFNHEMTMIQQNIRATQGRRESKGKIFTSEKWRAIMIRAIDRMTMKQIYDSNLLYDLKLIVDSIKQAKLVEAILNIEPFRPNFLQLKKHKEQPDNAEEEGWQSNGKENGRTRLAVTAKPQYRNSIIRFKRSVHERLGETEEREKHKKSLLEELLSYATEEETLTKEFESKSHPFRRIIQQYLFLVEGKYKAMVEKKENLNIQQIQESLLIDIKLLQDFIVKSSQPYITIFKTESTEERLEFQMKMVAFIKQYVEKHERVNIVIRKIMRFAGRRTQIVKQLLTKVPDLADITAYSIPATLQIDGCYVQSMGALVQFAESLCSRSSLQKLKQFRRCLAKDIDHFYQDHPNPPINREICAQTQIEIIKFVLAKLKYFLPEIFAQLRFLQVVYGESDMSYKYDDASYMYAQISVALQALDMDCQAVGR